ncbi:hypothetical protein [Nocardia brasiliensis]|uniref:hypothetical protein n=1 Tax=Nocardia brasiliensis TaxID=37326 RepID=UPI0036733EEE
MAVGTSGPLAEETPSMWWAVWGEYTGTDVLVTLDDLSHPPVMIFGKLWLTEWCGPEQEVIVVSGGRQAEVQFATPPDPPTGHPEDRSEDWHCVEAPAGFHDIPRLRTP